MTSIQPPTSRLAKVYRARLARNVREAERLLRKKLDQGPHEATLRALARLLVELCRFEDAQPFWTALARIKPNDFEATYHLAVWQVASGVAASDAVARLAPSSNERFRSRITRVITHPAVEQHPDQNLRHLAICGASYSGSTLLDRVFGSLPGVASIGESHWLTEIRNGTELDFSEESPSFIPCSVCGRSCPVLSLDFRMDLSADRTNWYQKIAERLETKVLVSADKNWSKLIGHDPLLRMDALVLFKSPMQAWTSRRAKLPPGDCQAYEAHLGKYIESWCNQYAAFLDSFRPTGTVTFLCFDDFAASRGAALERLCEVLNLPAPQGALTNVRRGHAIGGNKNAMGRLRASDYAFDVIPLPQVDLPLRERAMIDAAAEMQELYGRMRQHQDQWYCGAAD